MEITQAAFIVEFTRQKCLREGNEHNKTEFNEELRKQLGTGFPSAGSIFTKLRATGALKDTPTGYVFDIPGDVPIQEAYQRATGAVYTERYGCRMKQVPNWSDLFGPLPETTHEVDQTANEVDETELQLAVAEEAFEPATIIEKPDPTEARLLSMERQIGALTSALQFDKTAGNGQVATELQNLLKSQKGLVSMFNDRMQGLSDSIKGRGYRDLMKQFDNLTKEHGDLKIGRAHV